MDERWRVGRHGVMLRWMGLAGMLLLVALVYWPGLRGPFIFDDFPALVNNPRVLVDGWDPAALWRAAMSFEQAGSGRPLVMFTFALNHAISGLHPWGWKLTGVLVHLLNVVLVYLLCQRLLALAGVKSYVRLSSAGLALLWGVHPLQISSVLYVVQRMETLSLTFVLMALLAYLRGRCQQVSSFRGWPWIAASVLLALLSLGSKETGALFPLYTLALELTLLGFSGATPSQQRFWRLAYAIGCAVALLAYIFVIVPHYATAEAFAIRDYTAWERVLSQFRILPMYLKQILLPLPSSMLFYYDDFSASRSLLDPISTLFGLLLVAGLLVLACLLRRRAPLFALGVLWFFAAHAMTSNVMALELVFEHRNYFALLGVLLALADLVRRIPVRDGPAIKVVGIAALVIGVGFLGWVRAATWGNTLLLATDLASLNPQSARAAQDLGILYYAMADRSVDSPFFQFAVNEFEREMELPRASILAEQSLIQLHAGNDLPVDSAWWQQMHRRLRERPITPETTAGLFSLLSSRNKGVAMDDAALGDAFLLMFEKVSMPPYSYAAVAEHARKYRHNPVLEDKLLKLAVEHAKGHPGYVSSLADGLVRDGQPEQAEMVLEYAHGHGVAP